MHAGGELQGPVDYGDRWLVVAVVAVVLVALYYLVVLWWGRGRRPRGDVDTRDLDGLRATHLERIDAIERDVTTGTSTPRLGHQRLSETVRSYVGAVSPLPASTLGLTELRRSGSSDLADAIELMYPPEFAADDRGEADVRFGDAVARARWLVTTWT